ncbi:MAG TPA: apolipoprotein N-acyltransferase [Burkholderiales bacterium]
MRLGQLPPRAAVAVAFGSGAATVAGFAPAGIFPLPVLSLALLLGLCRGATPRGALALGFAFGAGLFGVGASWVYVSLHDFGTMPVPLAGVATLGFCAILSLYPAAAAWCLARLRARPATAALLAFPALWTLAEWLRGWVFTGFPWLAIGYSQTDSPLAGLAPVLGVYGVSWATALVAGLAFLVVAGEPRARIAGACGIAVVIAAGYGLGSASWTAPEGAPLRVSLLQGNIAQDLKFQEQRYAATLETYRRLVEASDATLIVLPETAVPRFFDTVDPAYWNQLARLARDKHADLLVGVPVRDAEGRYFNSLISLGVSPPQIYSKSHLVPFGEFIPPGFRWIVDTVAIPLADFSRGPERPRPLAVAGQRVAPDICYEDAFGEEIVRQLPEATLLVNASNVAWFGDSLAPPQHLQMSRMRALETGRYMLRATNTGVTAVIDERGRVRSRLPQFTEGALQASAQGFSGATPYVRWANAPALVLCALSLAAAAWLASRRRVGPTWESR